MEEFDLMKIIEVMPFWGLGGAETMCENLVYELKKLGHEIIVISLYDTKTVITQRFEKAGIDIRYLEKKPGLDFSMYKKLRKIFREEKPDVVHTHIHTTQYVFPVAKRLKIKIVHTIHSIASKEAPSLLRKFNKFYFKRSYAIPVALSENIQRSMVEEYKIRVDRVPIIFNGIDLSKCKEKSDYSRGEMFKIVHVASYQEVKNHFGLLDSFEQFHRKKPDTELHLIGDGQRRALIEQIVKDKGLSDCVFFYGFQASVHKFLHDMDVFTLPSLYEGMPMSIIEAMGTGLPIVATNVGGIPDMLTNGESAILTAIDCDEIANAFEKLYASTELRERLGKNAKRNADIFSSAKMANNYVKIYQGVLK